MESGEPVYPDSSDVSKAVPTTPAYNNASLTLTLPVLKDKQMTWSDVNWLALYCRKISLLFMSVNVPQDFARPQLCSSSTSNPLLEKRINLTHNAKSPGEVKHHHVFQLSMTTTRPLVLSGWSLTPLYNLLNFTTTEWVSGCRYLEPKMCTLCIVQVQKPTGLWEQSCPLELTIKH